MAGGLMGVEPFLDPPLLPLCFPWMSRRASGDALVVLADAAHPPGNEPREGAPHRLRPKKARALSQERVGSGAVRSAISRSRRQQEARAGGRDRGAARRTRRPFHLQNPIAVPGPSQIQLTVNVPRRHPAIAGIPWPLESLPSRSTGEEASLRRSGFESLGIQAVTRSLRIGHRTGTIPARTRHKARW